MIKKKSRSISLKPSGRIGKKIRKSKRASSTSFKRRERSQDEEHMESGGVNEASTKEMSDKEQGEEVKKTQSNDDAFNLPSSMIHEILGMISNQDMPTRETYMQWDECKKSLYDKMCTVFCVDYPNLKKITLKGDDEDGKKDLNEQVKKPRGKDDVVKLSWKRCRRIIELVRSRKTPSHKTYVHWHEYEKSFYRNMCTCYCVDYQDLKKEITLKVVDDEDRKKQLKKRKPSLREQLKNPPPPDHPDYEKLVQQIKGRERVCHKEVLRGPYDFGVYIYGKPKSIPRPLYLLVKEVVDIMNNNTDVDEKELTVVEENIRVFCNYFHAHLPTGWKHDRDKAGTLVNDYDPGVKPRDAMAGYYPIRTKYTNDYDKESHLSPREIDVVKGIIHSRKMPDIQYLGPQMMTFYCKLCSCFGMD